MSAQPNVRDSLIATNFGLFVEKAFRNAHGDRLGEQPYIDHMCYIIGRFIDGDTTRLLINLPPQHLKTFVGTICTAAYLLGTNPRLRILLVAYNDAFAEALAERVRDMMQSAWYRKAFATRIKDGHSRANDFATVEGGGLFAVSATGAVTGRAADVVLYDDPHEINDWNNQRKLEIVKNNFSTLLSRLHDKVRGRVLVVAHRVSDHDLSAQLVAEGGWKVVQHPLVAIRNKKFDIGHDVWTRNRGDVLRPNAYPSREIRRLERTQIAPPYELFFQQGMRAGASTKISADQFQSYALGVLPIGPVVLSIDPGHGGAGSNASRAAIQAWKQSGKFHYLIDDFCEACDVETLRQQFWRFVRRHSPSLALIEQSADGPALNALVRGKARFPVRLISPRDAKSDRLRRHLSKIRGKQLYLPADAIWRDAFIAEVVNFPGAFDDRVDTMTQYLDFADTGERLPLPQPRTGGVLKLSQPVASWKWQQFNRR